MSSSTPDSVKAELEAGKMKEGNSVVDENNALQVGADLNAHMYVDGNSTLQVGAFPFAVQAFAGVQNTANSVVTIEGSSTGTANDLMHLTLVTGANATATIAGYYRITILDDAGNINSGASGAYYAPFYTLN